MNPKRGSSSQKLSIERVSWIKINKTSSEFLIALRSPVLSWRRKSCRKIKSERLCMMNWNDIFSSSIWKWILKFNFLSYILSFSINESTVNFLLENLWKRGYLEKSERSKTYYSEAEYIVIWSWFWISRTYIQEFVYTGVRIQNRKLAETLKTIFLLCTSPIALIDPLKWK